MSMIDRADRLLELWARELRAESANPYKAQTILDGNYALGAGGRANPLKSYVKAKETRVPPRPEIDSDLILIDSIMSQAGRVNSQYPDVLQIYYMTGSIKRVAQILGMSTTKARELKAAAFDMVVALLEWREVTDDR